MTLENETVQKPRPANGHLAGETRHALDEVARHSLGRTGEIARAIEAGIVALRDGALLAPGHHEALEEFAWMLSESTPSAEGAGIGKRYVRWRDAVLALLAALRPDPIRELRANLAPSLTPQQAERLARPLSEQLYVLSDENGDLFLSDEQICRGSTSPVVLRDTRLWDAYSDACRAANKARAAVEHALECMPQPVTPATLTMRQISDAKQWAQENGRKGLLADATRCESASSGDPPLGAMRRVCKHLNDRLVR